MARPLHEIQAEIRGVRASINALPAWALRQGLDDDYLGQLDYLLDEEKGALAES
jgi:hypothetical protein